MCFVFHRTHFLARSCHPFYCTLDTLPGRKRAGWKKMELEAETSKQRVKVHIINEVTSTIAVFTLDKYHNTIFFSVFFCSVSWLTYSWIWESISRKNNSAFAFFLYVCTFAFSFRTYPFANLVKVGWSNIGPSYVTLMRQERKKWGR